MAKKNEIEQPKYGMSDKLAQPSITPKELENIKEARKVELAKKVKVLLDDIKNKADGFKKESVSKFKKDIIGMVLLPPKPQRDCPKCESENIKAGFKKGYCNECKFSWNVLDMLVLINPQIEDEKKKWGKKDEITKKLREIASKKLKDVNISTILLDEVWEMCQKGKYSILNLITMGLPIYDTNWVSTLKAVEMHKMMVLKKFEKYVVTYIVAGSLIRGDAKEGSDCDVYIVIDDTDVTRLTSGELRQKLLSIVSSMAWEAKDAAGSKIIVHPQVWVLTDMWEQIKNANAVIFSVIRDGISFYDRGLFAPWKLLLQKGKVTPSPEAIENYMGFGEKIIDRIKYKLKDIAIDDFFWATITPSQGALMLIGVPPPDHKATVVLMREHFVKNGLLEEKWVKFLGDVIKLRKDIEHGKLKEVSAKVIDDMLTRTEQYIKRLDTLFAHIEKTEQKKNIKQIYRKTIEDILTALKMIGVVANETNAIKVFEKIVVKRKLAPARYLDIIKKIEEINKDGKVNRKELASLSFEQEILAKEVFELIRIEKGKKIEKFKISANYRNKRADIWLLSDVAFIIIDTANPSTIIKKFKINKDGSLTNPKSTNLDELNKTLEKFAGTPTKLTNETIRALKEILADDLKIIIGA